MSMAVHYSAETDLWSTPQDFFDKLDAEFHFELDVCATPENAKCVKYFTEHQNGLLQEWTNLEWVRKSIPLESLRVAHLMIQRISQFEDFCRNTINAKSTPFICFSEFNSNSNLISLDTEIRKHDSENFNSISSSNVPTPRDTLIELSRLLGGNSTDAERIRQEIYNRLMYHLDLESQEKIRRSFFPARSLGDSFLDMYASFTVKKSGTISDNISGYKCIFHSLIIPQIGGFINDSIHLKPKNIWCNPPYGREIGAWIQKAYESAQSGSTVVCLVPSRTDTAWWHDYCMKGEIRLVRGRLKFGGGADNAPFPSAVIIFRDQPFDNRQISMF